MQRCMYDVILQNVEEVQAGTTSQCRAYFLDGPGGSGKTMLYNTVISALRADNHKVVTILFICGITLSIIIYRLVLQLGLA